MNTIKFVVGYFNKLEITLWLSSMFLIIAAFYAFDRSNYLTLSASIIGVTSLIFCAKGNPIGQFLMVIFSLLYGIISFTFAYYGEMVTYIGMTMPMAIYSLVSWIKNPFNGNKGEVKINQLSRVEHYSMWVLAIIVTLIFYFILEYFNTSYLILSTLSVTTSFIAVYLTQKRSVYYALAYGINDIVLIVLWVIAGIKDTSYLSVSLCFVVFLVNDIYGFFNWQKMKKRQLIKL